MPVHRAPAHPASTQSFSICASCTALRISTHLRPCESLVLLLTLLSPKPPWAALLRPNTWDRATSQYPAVRFYQSLPRTQIQSFAHPRAVKGTIFPISVSAGRVSCRRLPPRRRITRPCPPCFGLPSYLSSHLAAGANSTLVINPCLSRTSSIVVKRRCRCVPLDHFRHNFDEWCAQPGIYRHSGDVWMNSEE